jgi:hypothetical protein
VRPEAHATRAHVVSYEARPFLSKIGSGKAAPSAV